MKFLVSILMSFIFLFQGTAANMEVCEQIEEISHFISHFQQHRDFDGSSFIEYVYEDYIVDDGTSENHHNDSDHEDDPVHSNHHCCQHFVFYAPFAALTINDVFYEVQKQFNQNTFQLNSRYLESLFQPPRV